MAMVGKLVMVDKFICSEVIWLCYGFILPFMYCLFDVKIENIEKSSISSVVIGVFTDITLKPVCTVYLTLFKNRIHSDK